MSILNRIKSIFQDVNLDNIRLSKVNSSELEHGIKTDTVWFEDHNIEKCIRAVQKLGIEHIRLQTNTIDFLNDARLQKIKGINIQHDIENIQPLFNLHHLTHLGLPDGIKITFDFSVFKNLISLNGTFPKKYINIDKLTQLEFIHLFGYRKPDFTDFATCRNLKKLWIYSADIENLSGLSELENLTQIDLENCRKLTSLDGIGYGNIHLQKIHLVSCKRLRNADALAKLPNLKQLQLYQILELESLNFLTSLSKLETLMLHPSKVGVQNNNYYPVVETLKKLNKLENLRGWKPLKDYLQNKIVIESALPENKTDLALIKENLGIMAWTEKSEDGLPQYTKKNCKKAETILANLISGLENLSQNDQSAKEELIMNAVLELNKFNDSLDGCFIETGEREELCDLFDNIADAAGLNVQDYEDGIASKWREW